KVLLHVARSARLLSKFLPPGAVLWISSVVAAIVGRFCSREEKVSVAQLRYAFPIRLPEQEHRIDSSHHDLDPAQMDSPVVEASTASDEPYHRLARRVFRSVGESFAELMMWESFFEASSSRGAGQRGRITICPEGAQLLETLRAGGQGAVGLSAHLG